MQFPLDLIRDPREANNAKAGASTSCSALREKLSWEHVSLYRSTRTTS
jgi:hypothetical protein